MTNPTTVADSQAQVIDDWVPDQATRTDRTETTAAQRVAMPAIKCPNAADALSHWSTLIENFGTSSIDFYETLSAACRRREIPGLKFSMVDWSEGGIQEAKRRYLRVQRDDLTFDICAAPFGTGFFFSWWLAPRRSSGNAMVALIVSIFGFLALYRAFELTNAFGLMRPLYEVFSLLAPFVAYGLLPLAYVALLYVLALARVPGFEDAVLMIPIIGHVYRALFKRVTYYRIDTTLMFQSAIHNAVTEVIDGLTTSKGVRALSADERKPIMRGFFKR